MYQIQLSPLGIMLSCTIQVVFPMIPLIADVERMKRGGEHFAFDPEEPCYFGVLPRYGATGSEVKV
jgi:hypothetical protein